MNSRFNRGQSLVEFALLLPLFVLILIGVFDLGRAFFAYIAISNAAREGVRVYTFKPKDVTLNDIYFAVDLEIGDSTVVDIGNLEDPPIVKCTNEATGNMEVVNETTFTLGDCQSEEPIRVTLTYTQPLILAFFFPDGLTLVKSAEMMVP